MELSPKELIELETSCFLYISLLCKKGPLRTVKPECICQDPPRFKLQTKELQYVIELTSPLKSRDSILDSL